MKKIRILTIIVLSVLANQLQATGDLDTLFRPLSIVNFQTNLANSNCVEPDIPTITYSPSTICSDSSAVLNISGNKNDATAWHIYTGSCGGNLVGTTTNNTYTVNSVTSSTTYFVRGEGGCTTVGNCGSVLLPITPSDDASFTYNNITYCTNDTDPTPIITGVTGGSFSATTGLSINPTTGTIDLDTSVPGNYTVTYTTNSMCSNTSNQLVTIHAAPVINTQPIDQTECAGSDITFSVAASGNNLNYQWEQTCANNWTVYDASNSNGFPSDIITDVYESNGNIYVATLEHGLAVLEVGTNIWVVYNTWTTTDFPNNFVYDVYESNGNIYAATYGGGLAVLYAGMNTWAVYDTSGSDGFPNNNVRGVYESNGNIYAATGGGLAVLEAGMTNWTVYDTSGSDGFPDNITTSVYESNGDIYAGTGAGLAVLEAGMNTWTIYDTSGLDGFPSNLILDVYESNGNIYVGTNDSGLAVLYAGMNTWTVYDTTGSDGFPSNEIFDVYESNGNIYAATYGGLAVLYGGENNWTVYDMSGIDGFPEDGVFSVYESNNVIYAGTFGGGLATLSLNTTAIEIAGAIASNYTINSASAVNAACDYHVVISDINGCSTTSDMANLIVNEIPDITTIPTQRNVCGSTDLDLTTIPVIDNNAVAGTIITYHSTTPSNATDMSNQLTGADLIITSDQIVQVMVANPSTGCFDVESFMVEITEPIVITTEPINQTACTGENITLSVAATGTNLSYQWEQVCSNSNSDWTVYSNSEIIGFPSNSISIVDIHESNGNIYAATFGGGLAVLYAGTSTWTIYNNIPSDYAHVTDVYISNGNIYAATQGGLAILYAGMNTWTLYDGMGSDGFPFLSTQGVHESNGNIYVATFGGLAILYAGASTWTVYDGTGNDNFPTQFVHDVYESNGNIYAATNQGVAILYAGASTWTVGFSGFTIRSVYESNGNIYIASDGGGLAVLQAGANTWTVYNATGNDSFPSNRVYDVYVSNGTIYAATDQGLAVLYAGANIWNIYDVSGSDNFPSNDVYAVYKSNGMIYAATGQGAAIINTTKVIQGATLPTYTLSSASTTDANCSYQVVISDTYGCFVTSDSASLTVNETPDIAPIIDQTNACPATDLDLTTISIVDNNSVLGTTKTFHSAIPINTTDMTNELASTIVSADQTIYVMIANTATGCFDVESFIFAADPCYAPCPDDFVGANQLIGTQSVNDDYETNGGIESTQFIPSGIKVDYDSGTTIDLLPSFEVQLGAEFDAFIDGCNDGAGGNQLQDQDDQTNQK